MICCVHIKSMMRLSQFSIMGFPSPGCTNVFLNSNNISWHCTSVMFASASAFDTNTHRMKNETQTAMEEKHHARPERGRSLNVRDSGRLNLDMSPFNTWGEHYFKYNIHIVHKSSDETWSVFYIRLIWKQAKLFRSCVIFYIRLKLFHIRHF